MGNWDIARQALISPTNDSVLLSTPMLEAEIPVTDEMIAAAKPFGLGESLARWVYRAMAAVAPLPPPTAWWIDQATGVATPHYPERERITELLAETAELMAQGKHLRESAIFAIQTQIDRALMWEKRAIAAEAENAELRRLMTVQNDWITELNGKLAAFTNVAPKPEPAHNPFRDFPSDRRRLGP